MSKKNKIISLSLIVLNLVFALIFALYSLFNISFFGGNIFAAALFLVILADLSYTSDYKNIRSIIQLMITVLLFIINFASNYITGLSAYTLNKNYIGIASMILLLLINAVFIFVNLKKPSKSIKVKKTAAYVIYAAGILFLLSILIVGFVSLFAQTPINTNTINLAVLFIFLCVAVGEILRMLFDSFMSKHTKKFAVNMMVFAIAPLIVLQIALVDDIKCADTEFADIKVETQENMRQAPYLFMDEFAGIETDGFSIVRDVEYYSSDLGEDAGLTLRYDMYLPNDMSGSNSVLVNIHGSGGDKDTGNYAHRNKYFASRGYVVFDLQIGDWNEKNTGFTDDMICNSEGMLFYMDEFFRYISQHNDMNADLSSVFITGVSMGGGLASKYAYSYDNHLAEYGVELKGIIPIYPGYSPDSEGIDNYLNYVDANSVPTMIVMGDSDCIVRPQTVEETHDAYYNAGNPNCYALNINYGGHGSDSLMTGRFNQLVMYYAERFMQQVK